MKYNIFSLIFLFSATISGFAQDTIVLKNGDILSGEILEQAASHVYLKSAAFGSISINPRDISEIRITQKTLGEITVPEAAIAKNKAKPANLPASKPKKTAQPSKSAKESSSKKKKKQWSGQAGLAIAMRNKTTSNLSGVYKDEKYETYRIYGNLNWKGERNSLRWDWTYRYSEDEYKIRDDFFNITQKYNRSFKNKNLYATAKTLYQRDYNRRIENEYLQTAELGIKWFGKDSRIKLSTSAGGGYHVYDRLDSTRTSTTSVSQPKFIFDESLNWKILQAQELEIIQKYTHLGNLDDYHFVFSFGIQNKLVRELFLRVEYKIDKDTEVFYDDKGYYDKALLTSLVYKF
ncbi:DUF481 domain-containing protein [Pontiella agarivorans]|uniref:DUF481 domain-containing protein n=1 Tax=Pontiella agarivorans TaxID=3038953 RepID=A0ABU5N035_9BACT|nr:DUF481 domain-containing protein [Pontiella agarivorans]MDZ8119789.1 DUF481 domain-containing protein [Pontiella agarivorans]